MGFVVTNDPYNIQLLYKKCNKSKRTKKEKLLIITLRGGLNVYLKNKLYMKYFILIFAFCTSINYAFNQKELSSSQEKAIELHDLGYLTSLTGNYEKAIE